MWRSCTSWPSWLRRKPAAWFSAGMTGSNSPPPRGTTKAVAFLKLRHALARVLARGELRDPHLADVSLTRMPWRAPWRFAAEP